MNKKYLSKYSNGKYVSEAQYITEIICENKARIEKLDLHYRFWTTKKWSAFYRNQISSAHKLLNQHTSEAIVAALLSDKGKKIYSLRAPHLLTIIEQKQLEINKKNKTLTKNFARHEDKSFRKTQNKKNIISKIRNLDNES